MNRFPMIALLVAALVTAGVACAQTARNSTPAVPASADFSCMYTFLQEGEVLQINLEDGGKVTGYISRFGDSNSDQGAFLTQFLKSGTTDGKKLQFLTEPVHGAWFEFSGTVSQDSTKKAGDEGYFVLAGKLTKYVQDQNKKTSAEAREVTFKLFPQEEVETPKQE
jgi:hypothetical protein